MLGRLRRRKGPITLGLHAPPKPPLYSMRAMTYAARIMGLDSFTIWDHFQDLFPASLWDEDFSWLAKGVDSPHQFFDWQTLLGYLAADAGKLRLGVTVTESIRRHPILLAQAALTLAHVSNKAPILGIGAGEAENITPYGLSFERPVGRLEETLQILRMCFDTTGLMQFEGEFFNLKDAYLDLPVPKNKKPRIWVAAHGPRMLRLTGQYGDGWYPTAIASPEEYARCWAQVQTAAREAGRDPGKIMPAFQPQVVVGRSREDVRKMLDSPPIRLIGVLAPASIWAQFGEQHPFGEGYRGYVDYIPTDHTRQELEDAMAAVPLDVLGAAIISGTPEDVAGRLRDYADAGMRYAVLELASAAVSPKAAAYSLYALRKIKRILRA